VAKNGRFDVREIQWQDNKTSIRELTFRNVRRRAPSTIVAQRPAAADQAADGAPDTRHIAAFGADGGLIGTVRLAPLATEAARRGWDLGGMPTGFKVAELLGLSVAEEARDTPLPAELVAAAYERARSLGCHALVARVWIEQVMMYEAMGFYRYHAGHNDPERGFVVPMLLNLHDVAYLRLVESPLARLAGRYLNPDEHGPTLLARFADVIAETRPPSRGAREPAARAPTAPRSSSELDVDALVALLGQSARQRLGVGTRLLAPDLPSRDIYLLVHGTLGLLAPGEVVPSFYLEGGDVVAETAFAAAGEAVGLSIVTLTECTVVRMTARDLDRVIAADPTLGAQLLKALLVGTAARLARHLGQWRANRAPGPETTRWRLDIRRSLGAQRSRLVPKPK
jgi:GNAT superfamily N-acetyltransferase